MRQEVAMGLTLTLLCSVAVSQTPGTNEMLDIVTEPAVLTEGNDFELVVTGFNLAWAKFWGDPQIDGNVIRVEGFSLASCFAVPYPPRRANDRPTIVRLPVSGLSAGTYRLEGSYTGADCHGPVVAGNLEKNIIVYPQAVQTRYFHEAPRDNDVVSGVGVIRGWACYPDGQSEIYRMTYTVDEIPFHFPLPHGSVRQDTGEICAPGADINKVPIYSGYGGVVYWPAIVSAGEHTLRIYIDGVEVESARFSVVTPPPTEIHENFGYRKGEEGEYIIDAFLGTDESVKIRWSQADQNFIIVEYN